jgi:fucokinase
MLTERHGISLHDKHASLEAFSLPKNRVGGPYVISSCPDSTSNRTAYGATMVDYLNHGLVVPPDHLVVAASDENQAAGYRVQLECRRSAGLLPKETDCHILADPRGRRIGSGGSTLLALHHLAEALGRGDSLAAAFADQRIMIMLAGGASTRLPGYAAMGKLFVPLPCRAAGGHPAALFDLLLDRLMRLPRPAGGHVLVAAGDVLPTFVPAAVDFSRPGITGVAFVGGPERAARHGVYRSDRDGQVLDVLQKPGRAELRAHGILDEAGAVLIDTGLLSLDPTAVEALGRAAGFALRDGEVVCEPGLLSEIRAGTAEVIELYDEIAIALAQRTTPEDFERRVLARPRHAHHRHQAHLKRLYRELREVAYHVEVLSDCDFFHPGTSRELLAGLVGHSRTGAIYGFRRVDRAVVPEDWPTDRACVLDSVIDSSRILCGPGVLIEGAHVRGSLELAGRNILTGLPGEVTGPIRLPEGIGLLLLPVGDDDRWVSILYGVDDGSPEAQGSGKNGFLSAPIETSLARLGISPEWVWSDRETEQTGYHAKLWPVGRPDEVIALTAWMVAKQPDTERLAAWRQQERWSLAELTRVVDQGRLLAHRVELRRLATIRCPFQAIDEDREWEAERLAGLVRTRSEAATALTDLARGVARGGPPGLRARALIVGMRLRIHAETLGTDAAAQARIDEACRALTLGDHSADALGRAADAAVGEMMTSPVAPTPRASVTAGDSGRVVWATAPARLDFAGGWTDTPPICLERGGAVVNAAVTLDGRHPIQVFARWNDERVIRLMSLDSGRNASFHRPEGLLAHTDPTDGLSLPKACLYLAGLVADDPQPFDRGLDLTFLSAVPHGSGLGTSSILAAAMLSCLARLTGEDLRRDDLIRRTLLVEQRLTTGGGWQDQVGGVLPGVKLTRTRSGPDQTPLVAWLAIDSTFVRQRLLLYYTGLSRLAKGILRKVIHAYLAGEPQVLRAIAQLQSGALRMGQNLERRDYDAFGEEFRRYWELKMSLDPGVTTPQIEAMIDRVRQHCTGWGLLGAGGGGFLLLVARDEEAAGRTRAALMPGLPGARFVDFAIDERGLEVGTVC